MEIIDAISWVLIVIGSLFSIIGGIGIVRMPEFFSRLHGGGITDTLGAISILTGLMLQSDGVLVAVKLMMILFFLVVTSPSSCHALAKSAIRTGVVPTIDVKTGSRTGADG